jgi:hypothetical protein
MKALSLRSQRNLGINGVVSEAIQLELLTPWYAQRPNDTRTLDLYDAVVKFPFAVTTYVTEAERITTEFRFRDKYYRSEILPAQIKDGKTGVERLVFPGGREELVERTLRYLAVQQVAKTRLTSAANRYAITVFFTISMVRRHLENIGHGFNIAEIKEALDILSGTMIEISLISEEKREKPKRKRAIKGTILANYIVDFAESDITGEESYVAMTFHPLATEAIMQLGYYPMNAIRVGKLKSQLARGLATRMSHNFRGAQKPHRTEGLKWQERNYYHIALGTMLSERMMVKESRLRNNLAKAKQAIEELENTNFLCKEHPYEEKIIYTPGKRRPKITDAVWDLYPSDEFIEEIISGNTEMAKHRAEGDMKKQGLSNLPFHDE